MTDNDMYRMLKRRAKRALDNANYYIGKRNYNNALHERGRLQAYENIAWEVHYKGESRELAILSKAIFKVNEILFTKLIRG